MKKRTLVVIVIMLTALPLVAGRYAGDFMMIGAGVRSLGMGGAFCALADDGSAIYWNHADARFPIQRIGILRQP